MKKTLIGFIVGVWSLSITNSAIADSVEKSLFLKARNALPCIGGIPFEAKRSYINRSSFYLF